MSELDHEVLLQSRKIRGLGGAAASAACRISEEEKERNQ